MKRVVFAAAVLAGGAAVFVAPGCGSGGLSIDLSGLPEAGFPDGAFPDGGLAGPGGVGVACDPTHACRPGLTCGTDGKCAASHATAVGGDCQISAECNNGFCGADRKCAAAGSGDTGAQCKSDADCKAGLRCNASPTLDTNCAPEGNVDLGGACTASAQCFGGLLCIANPQAGNAMQCLPTLGVPDVPKPFQVDCEAETGDVQSYFDVPRGAKLKDFFRLPFPNDIRTKGTAPNLTPDYTDFPVPGPSVLGFDAVDRWARFIEKTGTGWSAYPAVTFRFSGEVDYDSFADELKVTHLVDLTDKAPLPHTWSATTLRSSYVCPNSIAFRPGVGAPLKPGHTYAAYMTTGAKTKAGPVRRGTDFAAMVAAADPGGDLSAAWSKYKPLRDWLSSQTISPDTILNAAVFTVGKVDEPGRDMGTFVEAATAPNAWTKCEAGTTSPCAQHDGTRNCPATPTPGIDEYHTVLKLPLYQRGKLPFLEPEDDGSFVPGAKQSDLEVCASITIPSGASATDVPVLIYGHGTGGSFRSQSTENVAARMAALKVAVLGIDQVGHGTRRGTETGDPSNIFFNFANPPAAQGNVLQGGADQIALVKLVQTGPTIGGKTLSKTKIAYWGHSQGATEGAISMPYAKGVTGVLFSGEGGSLIDSLLTKTSPINLLAAAPILISEPKANVDANHPVLTLFQNGIDPADPLNHAASINPTLPVPADVVQKHVFVPFGQEDTYATPITQKTYILAARLAMAPTPAGVTPLTKPLDMPDPAPGPVTANSNGFTAVSRQYAKPAARDGHFVIFADASAMADGDKFLKAVLVDGTAPSIP